MTKSTTYGEVAKWIRQIRRKCNYYGDVGYWHWKYKEMNTISDIIRILEQKDEEND
jgi:hypothetical protein